MWFRSLIHWSGPATVLGGAVWIAATVVKALQPEGCVGAECDLPGRSMREGRLLDAALFLAAVLLIGVGVVGLARRAQAAGRFGRLGRAGLVLGGIGLATIVVASLLQSVVYDGDFWLMPYAVIPGGLALVVGLLLLGFTVLAVLPRWVGALWLAGLLASLLANEQDARVLLLAPFGVAWLAVGYALWSDNAGRPAGGRVGIYTGHA
jgi:hypothetical protein